MSRSSAVATFTALHDRGCFVLPNPWDVGSAVALAGLGFRALASTSSGFAFTRAAPDEVAALDLGRVLFHLEELVGATHLPVNADFQNGYADEPEGVAENVRLCVGTGVAGLSIEDATGRSAQPLYEESLAIERIRAARRAIDDSGTGVLLTARCEAWLYDVPDARHTALERLVAFAEAGADCLYAPGVREAEPIAEIVAAVAPRPVNVLMAAPAPGLDLARLSDLGVRRVSVGSALSRVAWGAFLRSASRILETGSFDSLAEAIPFAEINAIFADSSTR